MWPFFVVVDILLSQLGFVFKIQTYHKETEKPCQFESSSKQGVSDHLLVNKITYHKAVMSWH